MNAETKGIWRQTLIDDVTILFDTTRTPNRITIQKKGENPTHIETDEITAKDIYRARAIACEAYGIIM